MVRTSIIKNIRRWHATPVKSGRGRGREKEEKRKSGEWGEYLNEWHTAFKGTHSYRVRSKKRVQREEREKVTKRTLAVSTATRVVQLKISVTVSLKATDNSLSFFLSLLFFSVMRILCLFLGEFLFTLSPLSLSDQSTASLERVLERMKCPKLTKSTLSNCKTKDFYCTCAHLLTLTLTLLTFTLLLLLHFLTPLSLSLQWIVCWIFIPSHTSSRDDKEHREVEQFIYPLSSALSSRPFYCAICAFESLSLSLPLSLCSSSPHCSVVSLSFPLTLCSVSAHFISSLFLSVPFLHRWLRFCKDAAQKDAHREKGKCKKFSTGRALQ